MRRRCGIGARLKELMRRKYGIGAHLNMMEQVLDVTAQKIITEENQVLNISTQEMVTDGNLTVYVDGVVFFQVIDAARAADEVSSLNRAVLNLFMTNIRTVVGAMNYDQLWYSPLDEINSRLFSAVNTAAKSLGIKITCVAIKKIEDRRHDQCFIFSVLLPIALIILVILMIHDAVYNSNKNCYTSNKNCYTSNKNCSARVVDSSLKCKTR